MAASTVTPPSSKSSPPLSTRLLNMLQNANYGWFSFWRGKMAKDISYVTPVITGPSDLRLYNVYHSANDTPFKVFETCVVDEDYSVLAIPAHSKHYDPNKQAVPTHLIHAAWMGIYSDYLELCDDGSNKSRLEQMGNIHVLSAKLEAVKTICYHLNELEERHHAQLFEALRESGFGYVHSMKDIKRVIGELKRDEVQLQMLINNLPKDEDGRRQTRQDFDDNIAAIGDVLKVVLLKDKIMLSDYCAYYRRMVRIVERRNSEQYS